MSKSALASVDNNTSVSQLEKSSDKSRVVTDLDLVRRVQAGEKAAFDILVLKYQHKIIKLVMRFLSDHSEAHDVTQDAFIKAYKALPKFRGDSAFYTWLYRIAVNTAKNYLVARGRRPRNYSGINLKHDDNDAFDPSLLLTSIDTPDRLAMKEELRKGIHNAISSLPEDLRVAVSLREYEGMSYEDIARIMNCPIGTVRSRIFRAREAIEKQIHDLLENTE
ncbi:MAG: RNA polymerase sigma factor RpoE [Gammaproteobacteria bacterium]|nr:RNA polymerase sigma factor RpoE [Gammaproteobacteria bacterium]NNC96546.1 RNA polymerase sigma factor RpoE [Gammaproteobacteria bacterium]NNM12905.1 RNA polymerase sigma factor RpoE [Gammaproteobacteria bacterium]